MKDEYFSYRLFLIESDQFSLFGKKNLSKKDILKETLNFVRKKGKVEFTDNNVRYLICYIKDFDERVYIFQFAREEKYTKPNEGEKVIETVQDKRFPFIYLILDFERQILLIQHKSSLFKDIDIPKSKIEKYVGGFFKKYEVTVKLTEMFSEQSFWNKLEEYDQIFAFDLTLSGPNLFGARYKAKDLVNDVHENYNASEFNIKLKNSLGRLKILKENVSEYLKLAAAGAGKVIAEVAKKGIKDKIGSFKYILKKHYDKNIESVTLNEFNKDFEELDNFNDGQDES